MTYRDFFFFFLAVNKWPEGSKIPGVKSKALKKKRINENGRLVISHRELSDLGVGQYYCYYELYKRREESNYLL